MCAQPSQLFLLQGIRMLFVALLTEFPTNCFLREHEETAGTENWVHWLTQSQQHGVSRPWFLLLPGKSQQSQGRSRAPEHIPNAGSSSIPCLLANLPLSWHKPALRGFLLLEEQGAGFSKASSKIQDFQKSWTHFSRSLVCKTLPLELLQTGSPQAAVCSRRGRWKGMVEEQPPSFVLGSLFRLKLFTRAEHHAVTPCGWKGQGPELHTGVICFLRLCTVPLHGEHLSP